MKEVKKFTNQFGSETKFDYNKIMAEVAIYYPGQKYKIYYKYNNINKTKMQYKLESHIQWK